MVPRLDMATTLRKLDTKVTPVTVVPALAVLLKQVTLQASKKPEVSVTSIALVATMASMASMVAAMASMVASMESKETPMASLASVTPMARMALASLDFVASMVWVTDLNRRILCNVMLNFTPLKTWTCSLTKRVDGFSDLVCGGDVGDGGFDGVDGGFDGFDGVDGGFCGVDGGFDGFVGRLRWPWWSQGSG